MKFKLVVYENLAILQKKKVIYKMLSIWSLRVSYFYA